SDGYSIVTIGVATRPTPRPTLPCTIAPTSAARPPNRRNSKGGTTRDATSLLIRSSSGGCLGEALQLVVGQGRPGALDEGRELVGGAGAGDGRGDGRLRGEPGQRRGGDGDALLLGDEVERGEHPAAALGLQVLRRAAGAHAVHL